MSNIKSSPTLSALRDLISNNLDSGVVYDTALLRAIAPSIVDAEDSLKYVSVYLTALTFSGAVPSTLVANGAHLPLNPNDLEKTSLIIIKRSLNELIYNYLVPLVKQLKDEVAILQNLENVVAINDRLTTLLEGRHAPESGTVIHSQITQ